MAKCVNCKYCKQYADGQELIPGTGKRKAKWIDLRCCCGYCRKFKILSSTDCKRFRAGQVTIFEAIENV
jgi:hypothetical protein